MKKCFVVISILCLVLGLAACKKGTTTDETSQENAGQTAWQEQYDLGIRLLNEGNYEEAILAFTAVIDIDPRNEDAWLMLADVYIRQNDFDKALEVLREGLNKTGGAQEIADKIKEIESGNIYDTNGNQRRLSFYDGNGTLIWYHIFTYNQDDRKTSVTAFDSAGAQTDHIDLVYDENGKCLVSYWYSSGGEIGKNEFEYDDQGNMTIHRTYTPDGTLSGYETSLYDDQGREIGSNHYDADGELRGRTALVYDAQGNLVEDQRYDRRGDLSYRYVHEYDENGKRQKTIEYNEEGLVDGQTIYHYNETGQRIGLDEYDAEGNLIYSSVNE